MTDLYRHIKSRPLYHYTSGEVINKIVEKGLMVNSKKNTTDGHKLGIYLTTDPHMNFFETINDSTYNKNVEIYRIEISTSQNIHAKLDPEFHPHVKSYNDLLDDLDIFENHLMLFIPIDIAPEFIEDIVKMEPNMERGYNLFGEM